MPDKLLCRSARAPKFGMLAYSFAISSALLSVYAKLASIYACTAAIFALASSTVSKWPSSSSYLTGSAGTAGSLAIYSYSSRIFSSTAASPAMRVFWRSAAWAFASATVIMCSPSASTVGFSLSSFSFLSYLALASFTFLAALSDAFILAHGFSTARVYSAAAARAAAWLASGVLMIGFEGPFFFGAGAASACYWAYASASACASAWAYI